MELIWCADQILGGRDYQEDFFAVIDGDDVYYDGQRYDMNGRGLAANQLMFVLADGMGGMGHGDVAAAITVEHFIKESLSRIKRGQSIEKAFLFALEASNNAIGKKVDENESLNGMGATLLAVLVDCTSQHISWISVGDSLLYLINDHAMNKLNEAHTWGAQADRLKIELEGLSETEIAEREHVLCSAVDGKNIKFTDSSIASVRLQPGDTLILASDGIESLSEKVIIQQASIHHQNKQTEYLTDTLLDSVKALGNPHQDNTTILAITVPSEQKVHSDTESSKQVGNDSELTTIRPAIRQTRQVYSGNCLAKTHLHNVVLSFPQSIARFLRDQHNQITKVELEI